MDGCDAPVYVQKYGWCTTHYHRWRRWGDPNVAPQPRRGARGPRWRGDDIDYHAAHKRVRTAKGSAKRHACQHCGRPGEQWAYDHEDPNEKPSNVGPFSTDPDHYFPLCRSCHTRFDNPLGEVCPAGHPRTEENTYHDSRGWVGCRPCRAGSADRHAARVASAV